MSEVTRTWKRGVSGTTDTSSSWRGDAGGGVAGTELVLSSSSPAV